MISCEGVRLSPSSNLAIMGCVRPETTVVDICLAPSSAGDTISESSTHFCGICSYRVSFCCAPKCTLGVGCRKSGGEVCLAANPLFPVYLWCRGIRARNEKGVRVVSITCSSRLSVSTQAPRFHADGPRTILPFAFRLGIAELSIFVHL